MTKSGKAAARGLRYAIPTADEFPDMAELALASRQWGRCLSAMVEALQRSGDVLADERIAFYREAGLEIHD